MYIVNELNEVVQNTTENYEQRPCWFDLKRGNIIWGHIHKDPSQRKVQHSASFLL